MVWHVYNGSRFIMKMADPSKLFVKLIKLIYLISSNVSIWLIICKTVPLSTVL